MQTNQSYLQLEALEPRMMLSTVQIFAAGSENTETMELQIDGTVVRTWSDIGGDPSLGQYQTYTYTTPDNLTPSQVRVALINSVYDPANNIDENIRVDAIEIDGVRYETESPAVFSTGTWKQEDGITPGFRQDEFLHGDGYFQYADPPNGVTTAIQVNAGGSDGRESFALEIDGVSVQSWNNIGTSIRSFNFQADGVVTADDVRVVFLNDRWEPAIGIDYNLVVDDIIVGGVQFETEASDVFSTGTWTASDGIVSGFGRGDTLHTNGYFQYTDNSSTPVNGGNLSLESSQYFVSENDGTVQIRVLRTGGSDGEISIDYATIDSTASAGEDYQARSGTLTFADGETSKTVTIPIVNDFLAEPDEQFSFAIDNLVGDATLLAPRTATISIDDNDVVQGTGDGLLGEYFSSVNLTNRVATRVDPTIAFDWSNGRPLNEVGIDNFSVRWTGEIEARHSELYTFTTRSDDGVRLWIDDQLIVDQWNDHGVTNHSGQIVLDAGVRYKIRMEYYENSGLAVAQLRWSSASQALEVVPESQLYAAADPGPDPGNNLQAQTVITGVAQPTSIDFSPDGRNMYISQKSGRVLVSRDGSVNPTLFVDISSQVNNVRDRGLLDLAIHPDFENNPYVYLLFTYDPPEVFDNVGDNLAGPDQRGNRAGRLIRVTADAATNYTTAIAGSEVVLLGKNSTWENFNAFANSTNDFDEPPAGILPDGTNVEDFIATDSESHTVGAVEFGIDGSLFVSIGDGTSYNRVDPRTVRVQDIDNLSGKVLRIDPITGKGLVDNPFFNGDPDANRSKVYHYGLRNPFRLTVDPSTGQLFIGDVGWTQWEEVNTGPAGSNFGWPYYEGGNGTNLQTNRYRDLPEAQAFYASGEVATPAVYGLNHAATGINAIIMGDVYRGNAYPAEYQGNLFVNDLGQGLVRAVSFDSNGDVDQVRTFTTGAQIVVQIVQGPDGNLYYVDLNDNTIGRWVFV